MPSPERNGEASLTTYLTNENREQFELLPPEAQQRLVHQTRAAVKQMDLLTTAILKQKAVKKMAEEAKDAGTTYLYSGLDRYQQPQQNENHIRFPDPETGRTASFLLEGHQLLNRDRKEFEVIQTAKVKGVYASETELVANQKEYDQLHEATNTRVSSEVAKTTSHPQSWPDMTTPNEIDPALTTAAAQAQVPQRNGYFSASDPAEAAPRKLTSADFAEMNRPRIVRPSQYGGGGRTR
ncbi:hypothetical protein ABT336_16890 [Micromonospora sp. NPDC000207]|uniref:hypothetical protein n=1 Tax=Micromonospora sp. NPDC000207 TaxID=3154246 RepID=UPI00332BFDEC